MTEALAAWSAVGSADIRWETTGVEAGPGIAEDRRNGVTVTDPPDAEFWGQASIWSEWKDEARGEWWTVECDIELVPEAAAYLGSDAPDNLATLIHEFGHCLGLDHAASHSEWAGWLDRAPGVFGEAPKMSYGWGLTNELGTTTIVGASCCGPRAAGAGAPEAFPGWSRQPGNPRVMLPSSPSRGPGGARGVGAFTDEEGRFLIEGLPPGDYRIRGRPVPQHKRPLRSAGRRRGARRARRAAAGRGPGARRGGDGRAPVRSSAGTPRDGLGRMIASVWRRPAVRRLAAAAPLAFAACGGGPAAPAPPSVAVSFVQSRLEVSEGETAEIAVRYRVRGARLRLDAPARGAPPAPPPPATSNSSATGW